MSLILGCDYEGCLEQICIGVPGDIMDGTRAKKGWVCLRPHDPFGPTREWTVGYDLCPAHAGVMKVNGWRKDAVPA